MENEYSHEDTRADSWLTVRMTSKAAVHAAGTMSKSSHEYETIMKTI
jgi:hypothetical protein